MALRRRSARRPRKARPARIADRLASERRSGFVGRRAELDRFHRLLADSPAFVLHVHGPGVIQSKNIACRACS